MKSSFVLAVLSASLLISFTTEKTSSELVISEAVKKGFVSFNVKGKGGHSGFCLKGIVQNKSTNTISVVIPAGMIMEPADSTMQDLILVKAERIILKKGEIKPIELSGFCSIAGNRSPSEGMTFFPVVTKNQKLRDLAEFISKNQFSDDAIQSAVWCVSDGKNISEIYADNQVAVAPLRAEVSKLTGQKDNWYSIQASRTIDENGYIQSAPVLVTGEIKLKLDKPEKIKQEVCKENGEVVWSPNGFLELPKSGSLTYSFKLKVRGWEPGKYFVRASIPGRVLIKQEFSI